MVGLNFRLSPREIADIIDDARPALVFVEDEYEQLLAEVAQLPPVVWLDRNYEAWRDAGDVDAFPVSENEADAVVLLSYTGGTTGRAKGVMLLERNVDANMRAMSKAWLMKPPMRCLAMLPLFHVSGTGLTFSPLHVGGEVVLLRDATPELILCELSTRAITHTALVPSMIAALLAHPASRSADLSSLRVLVYGAAPSADTTIGQAMGLMPACAFFHGYGLTETCGGIAIAPPHRFGDPDHKHGTVGQAIPTYQFRIVDPHTLQDVPTGGDGEVWVRGPQNTIGYWHRPEETARVLMPDGWLRTGDVGTLDEDGFLYLKDRLKDMIITGGENVYSVEVENVLTRHPSVLEAAVFGVPDERWGESVHAVVTLVPDGLATPEELIAFARERLAHYKCPKVVDIARELPTGGSGKVLKRQLRDEVIAVTVNLTSTSTSD